MLNDWCWSQSVCWWNNRNKLQNNDLPCSLQWWQCRWNMIGLDLYTRYELQRQWMQTMDLMSKNNVWRGGGLGLWWGNNSCGKIHVWVTSYDHTWNTLLVLMNGGWLWFCLICPYCLRWICWWCSVDGGDLCSAPLWRGVRRPGGAHIGTVVQTLVHPGGADILVVDCCDTNWPLSPTIANSSLPAQ